MCLILDGKPSGAIMDLGRYDHDYDWGAEEEESVNSYSKFEKLDTSKHHASRHAQGKVYHALYSYNTSPIYDMRVYHHHFTCSTVTYIAVKAKHHSQFYTNGSTCDLTGGHRKTEVILINSTNLSCFLKM